MDPSGPLGPRVLAQMRAPEISTQAPPNVYYGLGLFSERVQNVLVVGHEGVLPGFHSALYMEPATGTAAVVLINGDGFSPSAAAVAVLGALAPLPQPQSDWSTPPSDWMRYVGTYREPTDPTLFPQAQIAAVRVELANGALSARTLSDNQSYALTQVARDTWSASVQGQPITLTFWRDLGGRAQYIATRIGVLERSDPHALE